MLTQEDLEAVREIVREELERMGFETSIGHEFGFTILPETVETGETVTIGSSVLAQRPAPTHWKAYYAEYDANDIPPLPDGPLGACSRCGGEHIADHPCRECIS